MLYDCNIVCYHHYTCTYKYVYRYNGRLGGRAESRKRRGARSRQTRSRSPYTGYYNPLETKLGFLSVHFGITTMSNHRQSYFLHSDRTLHARTRTWLPRRPSEKQ